MIKDNQAMLTLHTLNGVDNWIIRRWNAWVGLASAREVPSTVYNGRGESGRGESGRGESGRSQMGQIFVSHWPTDILVSYGAFASFKYRGWSCTQPSRVGL